VSIQVPSAALKTTHRGTKFICCQKSMTPKHPERNREKEKTPPKRGKVVIGRFKGGSGGYEAAGIAH
jgi:hypothetical protein